MNNKPTDTEILDWLERCHTLHYAVEALYVVDGYEADITYDGNQILVAGKMALWHGETLREAYIAAMKEFPEPPKREVL